MLIASSLGVDCVIIRFDYLPGGGSQDGGTLRLPPEAHPPGAHLVPQPLGGGDLLIDYINRFD